MSFENERKSIESRFENAWTFTPIAFDNVPFNPPSNSDWVRLTISNGDSDYRSLQSTIRHTGVIIVQIFTPINQATKSGRQYADMVADIFSDQNFDDIKTDVSSINISDDDDTWLQTNVSTPYYRDAEKISVPVPPVFQPLYVVLNDKIEINAVDPEIIMSGDVDIITPTKLEISGVMSCTFNDVVGVAVYLDDVAIGTGTRLNNCHDDCAFVHHNEVSNVNQMTHFTYDIATDVLSGGIHNIKIGIIGKWLGNEHTIYVGDVFDNGKPSASTLLVKEFRAIQSGTSGTEPLDAVNIEISSLAELEAIFGVGTYNVISDVNLTFTADIVIPGVFNIASDVDFIMHAKTHSHVIEFTNTGTIFTHAGGTGELRITQGKFTFSGIGATLFDINVSIYVLDWATLDCEPSAGITLGSVIVGSIFKITNTAITGFTDGFTIDTNLVSLYSNLFQSTLATSNTVMTFTNIGSASVISDTFFVIGANENLFYIPPENTGNLRFTGAASFLNNGNFFESGSLTETSKYITVENAGRKISSNTGSAMSVKDNTALTNIASGNGWNSLNLGTAIFGDLNSRFEWVDQETGEREYDGLFPIKVGGLVSISAKRSGGAVSHSVRMIKTLDPNNDPFDDVEMQRDIGTVVGNISFTFSGILYPGDRFRPEVMASFGSTDITITSYSDTIK